MNSPMTGVFVDGIRLAHHSSTIRIRHGILKKQQTSTNITFGGTFYLGYLEGAPTPIPSLTSPIYSPEVATLRREVVFFLHIQVYHHQYCTSIAWTIRSIPMKYLMKYPINIGIPVYCTIPSFAWKIMINHISHSVRRSTTPVLPWNMVKNLWWFFTTKLALHRLCVGLSRCIWPWPWFAVAEFLGFLPSD